MIIDADGHYVESLDAVAQYLDPEYREAAPRHIVDDEGRERLFVAGKRLGAATPFAGAGDIVTPRGVVPGNPGAGRTYAQREPGGFDAGKRLEWHDAEGIDASVLFPSVALVFGGLEDPDMADAFCRAVNRWAAALCSEAPAELYAVANIAAQDPDLAAAELRRCVEEHGFVGAIIRPNPYRGRDGSTRMLGDPAYDVLWQTAADLDVSVCVHEGANVAQPAVGQDRAPTFLLYHAIVHPAEQMLAFGSLFERGVFDRFPTVRFGFFEANAGWMPFWLHRLEEHCETMGWTLPHDVRRLPTEIFAEQCWVGCEGEEWGLAAVVDELGPDKVMWASDYPHFDAKDAGRNTATVLERTDLTDAHKAGVLGEAALRFFGLDAGRIEAAVSRRHAGATPAAAGSGDGGR